MDPIIITAAAMIACRVLALLGLWLRLRSQAQREHAHRRLLVDVVRALPRGGQVHERHADGSRISLSVAPGPAEDGGSSSG